MDQLMKEFEGLMESGDFEEMFQGIFDEFVSRDILYEPLKVKKNLGANYSQLQDLSTKYPAWIEKNSNTAAPKDLSRYRKQHETIVEILSIFDACGSTEPGEKESERITQLITVMQEYGNPPEDLMPDLPGFSGGNPETGECPIQ